MKFMPIVLIFSFSCVLTTFAQTPTTSTVAPPTTTFAPATTPFAQDTTPTPTAPPPPPTTPAPPCSGHGTCHCNPGWTGPDCNQPVDWCTQPLSEIATHPQVQDVCGNRGTCTSSPDLGATCNCFPGYSGTFCDILGPGMFLSNRCHAYNISGHDHEQWTPYAQIGCGGKEECVPDDLQCLLTPCQYADTIGWCLPNAKGPPPPPSSTPSVYKIREFGGQQWFYKYNAKDATPCNGHGTCTCVSGYQGPDCADPVDWCNTKAPGFNGTGLIKDACGFNGTCRSTPAGAWCVCDYGFTGEFCDQLNPDEVHISRRCYVYAPTVPQQPNVTIGCPRTDEACIPENLQCFVPLTCANPIGWCQHFLPHTTLEQFLEMAARLFQPTN